MESRYCEGVRGMKNLVVYPSPTGNIKKVAHAIYEVMHKGTDIHPVEEAANPHNYDFIAIGYNGEE